VELTLQNNHALSSIVRMIGIHRPIVLRFDNMQISPFIRKNLQVFPAILRISGFRHVADRERKHHARLFANSNVHEN
jgi:hypothetical protein